MGGLLFTGGTIVTADGSFEADVLVEDEKIVAVGTNIAANGTETVDASGKLIMPGFIDAHTHMAMPFGGTMTADDWATGTEAAVAGGTTTIIDFALQEVGGTLAGAFDAWTEKARDRAVIDYGFHVAITDLRDDIKAELPDLAAKGVASVKIFMAYKGTPLYTEDDDLFETLQLSKEAGVLVLVHAENGDAIAKLQQQALARGDTAPKFHALTRPEAVEAEATNRAIRLAEVAEAPILVVHVSCAPALEEIHRAHERGQTVYAETSPSTSPSPTKTWPVRASRVQSMSARRRSETSRTAPRCGTD
jgi:dihydropyrimidinase